MKRLLFLAIVGAVAWYGWQNRGAVFGGSADSEVVLVNAGIRAMQRVRLTVDGETYVREVIEPDARAHLPVRVTRVSDFRLVWEWRGLEASRDWQGGQVTPGPPRSRCTIQVFDDNEATVTCVPIPTDGGR